jgi:hypothetical protein
MNDNTFPNVLSDEVQFTFTTPGYKKQQPDGVKPIDDVILKNDKPDQKKDAEPPADKTGEGDNAEKDIKPDDNNPDPVEPDGGGGGGEGDGDGGNGDGIQTNEPPADSTKTGSEFKNILIQFHKRGLISDVDAMPIVDNDDLPITEITEENFFDVAEALFRDKQESDLAGKVDASKISDLTKTLIDIESRGGDISTLLDYYQRAKLPVQEISLDTEEGQTRVAIIFRQYAKLDKTEEDADTYIEGLKSRGKLKEYAEKAKEQIEKMDAEIAENAKTEAANREKQAKQAADEYRKSISETLKGKFQLTDAARKSLADFAVERDRDGSSLLSKAINKALGDPDMAADLLYFLRDKDGYIKQLTVTKTNAVNRETMDKILRVPRSRTIDNTSQSNGKVSKRTLLIE